MYRVLLSSVTIFMLGTGIEIYINEWEFQYMLLSGLASVEWRGSFGQDCSGIWVKGDIVVFVTIRFFLLQTIYFGE